MGKKVFSSHTDLRESKNMNAAFDSQLKIKYFDLEILFSGHVEIVQMPQTPILLYWSFVKLLFYNATLYPILKRGGR